MMTEPTLVINRVLQTLGDKDSPFRKGGLSTSHFLLLLAIHRKNGPFTMSEVTKFMGYSTAAATGTVDRLESLGYLTRVHGQEDRRKVMVYVSEKGIRVVEETISQLNEAILNILKTEFQQVALAG